MSTLADNKLEPFLRELADSIRDNNLIPEQLQHIGEFYMSWKIRNDDTTNGNYEDLEIVRFLTLGLYIYRFILNDEQHDEKISLNNI
jgi:hypothetical protein